MKNKFLIRIAVLAFVAFTALAVNAHFTGNKEASAKFTVVSLCIVGIVATKKASLSMGFFGDAGLKALQRNATRFGIKTQSEINNIEAPDYTLYVRRQITGLNGVYRLIEADNIKTKGITNIDKNRLPEGDNIAVEAIWIAEGNHATATDPKNITNYTNVASSVQAEFRHAELVITQDSKEKLRLPISSMLAPAANTNGSKKDVAYHIKDNPLVLIENVPFEINIEFPAAMAAFSTSTNKFHVEVELFCKRTQRKYVG